MSRFPALITISYWLLSVAVAGCQSGPTRIPPTQTPRASAQAATKTPATPSKPAAAPARLEIADRQPAARPASTEPQPHTLLAPPLSRPESQAQPTPQPAPPESVIRATAPAQPEPLVLPPQETPTPAPKPAAGPDKLRELHAQAATKYQGVNDYIACFHRREVLNGKPQPPELIYMRFRKDPFSIYFKWLEGESPGRECIFVKGKYNNMMKIRSGKGDFISGIQLDVDPKSERATSKSRRSIEEAGIGNLIDRFGVVLAAHENGTKTYGTLQYLGPQQRQESRTPMECVVQQVPPGLEKHLARGGQRYWFFNADPQALECNLPVLIVTLDDQGKEVEYYAYDRLNLNVGLRPEEFDPDVVYGIPQKK